jgi:hypothetical protein
MEAERKDFGLMLHPPSSDAAMIRSELADVETAHDIIAAQRTRAYHDAQRALLRGLHK